MFDIFEIDNTIFFVNERLSFEENGLINPDWRNGLFFLCYAGSKYVVVTNGHVSTRRSDGVDRLLNGHPGSRQGTIVERGRRK